MSVSEYLERVDGGEDITISQMLTEGAEEEIIEIIDEGDINGANIELSKSYANEKMYDRNVLDYLDSAAEIAATGLASLPGLENLYDDGFERADGKMEEIDNKYSGGSKRKILKKKAGNAELKMKASEGLLAGGAGGFLAGNQIGSQKLMALSAASGGLGAYGTAKMKGEKDRSIEEAARGLEQAYGGYQLDIN
ncbi:MAG: hypothetical protein ACI9LV_000030 [Candidatus Nanohaloarchaea archaeon]|jgi:hypothetical protein